MRFVSKIKVPLVITALLAIMVLGVNFAEARRKASQRENIVQSFIKYDGYTRVRAESATDVLMRPQLSQDGIDREIVTELMKDGSMTKAEAERAIRRSRMPMSLDEGRRARLNAQDATRSSYTMHCAADPHSIYC